MMKRNKKKTMLTLKRGTFWDSIKSMSHLRNSAYKIRMHLKIESFMFVKYWMMNLTWIMDKWRHVWHFIDTTMSLISQSNEARQAERQISVYCSITNPGVSLMIIANNQEVFIKWLLMPSQQKTYQRVSADSLSNLLLLFK